MIICYVLMLTFMSLYVCVLSACVRVCVCVCVCVCADARVLCVNP